MRYFVAGNFWLFIVLLLVVGKTFERSSPTRYSVFGTGYWFSPFGYNILILCVLLLALYWFLHDVRRRRP